MSFDWQFVAVVACVAWAAAVVVRRTIRLFSKESSNGCGSGGCSACPSNQSVDSHCQSDEEFVPLQTLVQSSRSVTGGPPA